jgi:hypothetical protein
MNKPEIEITKSVDLMQACKYLEANGFPKAEELIFDEARNLADRCGELTAIHLIEEPDLDGSGYMTYTKEYADYVDALWALYPDEDAWTLSWKVSW